MISKSIFVSSLDIALFSQIPERLNESPFAFAITTKPNFLHGITWQPGGTRLKANIRRARKSRSCHATISAGFTKRHR